MNLKILGPKLPFVLVASTMISSPTEKGVVIIGGGNVVNKRDEEGYSHILELSGDSKETLVWKILDQKLRHPRLGHVSFSISNHIAASLTRKTKIK